MGWKYGMCGKQERCIQGFVRKPEGKRKLGRPGRGWEDNIKMEIKWAWGMDWINLPSGVLL